MFLSHLDISTLLPFQKCIFVNCNWDLADTVWSDRYNKVPRSENRFSSQLHECSCNCRTISQEEQTIDTIQFEKWTSDWWWVLSTQYHKYSSLPYACTHCTHCLHECFNRWCGWWVRRVEKVSGFRLNKSSEITLSKPSWRELQWRFCLRFTK